MAMFVYLDESGDTGFRFEQGSSRYFVVMLLLVDDPIPLQTAVGDLRDRLGFAADNEFKFYSSSHDVRLSFLRMLRRQDFVVRALVIDKTRMTRPHMRKRETFYNYLVRMILEHDNSTISDAMVVLDESVKSKKSKQQLATYLRKALNMDPRAPKVRGVRYHDSRSDNLIQVADMVCGAIYAKYHRGDDTYYREIGVKVGNLWEWRPYGAQ
jgi:hypothetical protein